MSCVFSLSHIAYLVLLPVANAQVRRVCVAIIIYARVQGGAAGNLVFLVTVSEAADLAHWAWNQLLGRRFPWRIVAFSSRTWCVHAMPL